MLIWSHALREAEVLLCGFIEVRRTYSRACREREARADLARMGAGWPLRMGLGLAKDSKQ